MESFPADAYTFGAYPSTTVEENPSPSNTNIPRVELSESDLFRSTMTKAMFTEFCNLHLERKKSYENLRTLASQAIVDLTSNQVLKSVKNTGNEWIHFDMDSATRCAALTSIFTQSSEHLDRMNNEEMVRILDLLTELTRTKAL